jgi:trimeric autotransporter adhesin
MTLPRISGPFACFVALVSMTLSLASATSARAQTAALVTQPVDESRLVQLSGGMPRQLRGAKDLGALDASQPSGRILLLLKRSNKQEADLQSFLQQSHQPGSASFHKWLTPQSFGQRFGLADSDVQQVNGWLQSHGLTVAKVSKGKNVVEFSGTVGQINEAFHTSIHKYDANGTTHYANATEPKVPAALAPAIAGVTQLNDIHPKSMIKTLGQSTYNPKTHKGTPQWTYPDGAGYPDFYYLAPEDFATEYDVKPVYAAGITGAGQTIGILNDSNIDLSLVAAYRKLFGLPATLPQVIIDGSDPGINGDAGEAYLDVENAGAIAPGATIKLYIAGEYGFGAGGGLIFSIVRAVDDDDASILSLSFGESEYDLETAGNQFFNSMWEQAAAQGQTVLVSTGDSGTVIDWGLDVNGLASTPWDIAVGGSDFYYTDYATGGASIVNFWTDTNDPNLGSLQKPVTEQPWNTTQYGLNDITYESLISQEQSTAAGSGGASDCAVGNIDPVTYNPDCISGYAKPTWQAGVGVPNDSVRDLPDISLFAANGPNGTAWATCAFPGDCVDVDPVTGATFVTGVGGTSASAPAMAGVMALIDQKYGAQGQANFTLYPVAAQFPATIKPIDIGSNNTNCFAYGVGYYIGCIADPDGDGFFSFQVYNATPGFDLASGLGSLDVNQLLTNWGSVSFKSSTTALTLTPTTLTHGQTVTASATVTGTGTASPTGGVSLVSSQIIPGYKGLTAITLGANGAGSTAINFLPGGTYTISGQYGGDGVDAASTSTPVTVTVSPEASVVTFAPLYYNIASFAISPVAAGSTIPLDDELTLDAFVVGASAATNPAGDGAPTGSVTFLDNGVPLGSANVSVGGTAEISGLILSLGSHSITVSYTGDPSFTPSSSAPFAFNISQDASGLVIQADPACITDYTTYPYAVTCNAGQPLTFDAQTYVNGYDVFPTGTITYQLDGGPSATSPVIPLYYEFGVTYIPLPAVTAGVHTVTAAYSGDINFTPSKGTQTFTAVVPTLLPSTTTIAIATPSNTASPAPGAPVTFTATVTGSGGVSPTGTITFNDANFTYLDTVPLTPGANGTATASISGVVADLLPGQNAVAGVYSGDSVYAPSSSAYASINFNAGDFSIQAMTPILSLTPGETGSVAINLSPINSYNGPLTLTCISPAALFCKLDTATLTLSSNTIIPVFIDTITPLAKTAVVGNTGLPKSNTLSRTAAAALLAGLFVMLLPKRRRFSGMALSLAVSFLLITAAIGCGNNGNGKSPASPATQTAAPGTYTVVITGTSSTGSIHNTAVTVIVQ